MRSEKALNLFSQIVGVKELNNLNDFIRSHMLEKSDMDSVFSELYTNFDNLLATQRLIDKAETQLTQLKPVLIQGLKYEACSFKRDSLIKKRSLFPLYSNERISETLEQLLLAERELTFTKENLSRAQSDWEKYQALARG